MAGGSITFWRRVAQVAALVITLIVVVPYLLPRSLHAAHGARYIASYNCLTASHTLLDKFRKHGGHHYHGGPPPHSVMSFPPPKHNQHPYLEPNKNSCEDPFLEPGILTTNASDRAQNFWTPFNSDCPRAPHFLQDVIDRKPLPWLQGRTLLMVGDSVDRNNLRFFCELAGSENMRVTSMTNLSEVIMGDTDLEPWNIDPGDLTRPRVCRIDEYDFEIIMFFHYGMQDEEIWTEKNVYTPPGLIEKRIPLLKGLMEDYGRKPDMIILASGISSA